MRVLGWVGYFVGELLVLVLLWGSGAPGYDVEEPVSQFDGWRGQILVLAGLLVLGLAGLALFVVAKRRSGGGSTRLFAPAAGAGLLAVAFGPAMLSQGAGGCYRVVELVERGVACSGTRWTPSVKADVVSWYQHVAWVVIAAGAALVLFALVLWLRARRAVETPPTTTPEPSPGPR